MKIRTFSQRIKFRPLLILLSCFCASTASCGQGGPHAPVSQTQVDNAPQRIREGVVGRVATRDGQAIAGAMIVPTPRSRDAPPIPEIAITTDGDGQYRWHLQPGPYQISVIYHGFTEQTLNVEVRKNQVSTLNFILHRRP